MTTLSTTQPFPIPPFQPTSNQTPNKTAHRLSRCIEHCNNCREMLSRCLETHAEYWVLASAWDMVANAESERLLTLSA